MSVPVARVENDPVASRLEEVADLLEAQQADPFRVLAWRRGAERVRALEQPLALLYGNEGLAGLDRLSGIGPALARAIAELVETGRLRLLERLRGETGPEIAFATVSGIGSELARRIHGELGIETLYDLEAAAWDGRLARVKGIGPGRIQFVKDALAGRLGRARAPLARHRREAEVPDVAELLDVDREYRERAAAGTLPRVAPRRLNPSREAWLPILHTGRGPRQYTALFSNTARAHELGATHDWVVIARDDRHEGQWTVVTAKRGLMQGRRVVRGRETECLRHHGLDPDTATR